MSQATAAAPRPGLQLLDEAIVRVETRRWRRWFAGGWRPAIFILAVVILPWAAAPGLLYLLSAGVDRSVSGPHWAFGSLLVSIALGCATAGFMRATQFWYSERGHGTLESLLLTRQAPRQIVASTCAMSTGFAILLACIPAVIELFLGFAVGLRWWQWLEGISTVILCALLGAALGSAVFFLDFRVAPRGWATAGLAVLAVFLVAIWLRIEFVQGGWGRPWEEHPQRLVRALALLTPVPVLYGISEPDWWQRNMAAALGLALPAYAAGILYAAGLTAASALCYRLAQSGLACLWADPAQLGARPAAGPEETGGEYYWHGFRNPVWTREIRTRLRSRETAEFIFVASLAVAAGGFVPLFIAARDLSDPLQTASVARQVFYWLTMTLMGLVCLVSPGMAAEAFGVERRSRSLDFLIATPLRPREIVLGKILGSVSVVSLLLSPSLPLFGLCYLFRGASGAQVFQVYLLLLFTTLFAAFIGVTASAMHASTAAAKWQAYLVVLLFVLVPGGAFWVAGGIASPAAELRQQAAQGASLSLLVLIFCAFAAGLLGVNATERLRHSE
jgi:hypothetical protein